MKSETAPHHRLALVDIRQKPILGVRSLMIGGVREKLCRPVGEAGGSSDAQRQRADSHTAQVKQAGGDHEAEGVGHRIRGVGHLGPMRMTVEDREGAYDDRRHP